MDTRLAKRNYSIQQWKAIIQDRNNTNLTVDEYCKQNGLSRNSYFYLYIPTGVYRLHGVLEPASRKVRTTFTETEPMQI